MLGQRLLISDAQSKSLPDRVELIPVRARDAAPVLRYRHYLGRTRTGAQLHYAIALDGVIVGVVSFAYPMTAAVCGIPADEVVELARLYLETREPNLASCAIAKALRVIREDWAARWPDAEPIRAVVAWSDATRHVGTVYAAANFRRVGRTARGDPRGRYRGPEKPRLTHEDYANPKDCWIWEFDE